MPVFPDDTVSARNLSMSFVGVGGDTATIQIDGVDSSVLQATIEALADDIASVTNMGMYRLTNTLYEEVGKQNALAFDEAYSSPAETLVLEFQTPTLLTRTLRIPAPDASYFLPDGVTFDRGAPSSVADDVIVGFQNVINAGGGEYEYVRGYRATRGRKAAIPRVQPQVEEPSGAFLPPAAPALPEPEE